MIWYSPMIRVSRNRRLPVRNTKTSTPKSMLRTKKHTAASRKIRNTVVRTESCTLVLQGRQRSTNVDNLPIADECQDNGDSERRNEAPIHRWNSLRLRNSHQNDQRKNLVERNRNEIQRHC